MSIDVAVGDALAGALAVVLTAAGYLKLRYRRAFVASVSTWGLSKRTSRVLTGLPFIELGTAAFLVSGIFEARVAGPGRLFASVLFLSFVVVQLALLRAATPAKCGCFGRPRDVSWPTTVRAAAFGLLAVLALAL
ncbi:MAG TPA: MauE/DoxX family redox-associated membrane protein [Tepidiformaceae bacterium]|nr:MauE/DoxX family redox-associated membrane protein [Tepidiformaceae bacterium]